MDAMYTITYTFQSQEWPSKYNFLAYTCYNIFEDFRKMYNKFNEKNNSELCSCHDLQNHEYSSPSSDKERFLVTMPGGQDSMQAEPFYMKSSQPVIGCFQISFQNRFMEEHKAVFLSLNEKIMEFYRIRSKLNINLISDQKQIVLKNCQINEEQMNSQIQNEEKLHQFIEEIVKKETTSPISQDLVIISYLCLKEFNKVRLDDLSVFDLLELAQGLSNKLQKSTKVLNQTNLKITTKEDQETLNSFLKIYCSTSLLVIAKYFENPYNNADGIEGYKRPFSPLRFDQDEDSQELAFESTPLKKRKFSF